MKLVSSFFLFVIASASTYQVRIDLNSTFPVEDDRSHPIEAFAIVQTSNGSSSDSIVEGTYLEAIPSIGQSRFVASTIASPAASDKDYFYAIGLAEGYLTAKRIVQQMYNVVWTKPRQDPYIYEFLSSQYNYMRTNSNSRWREDSFWFQVGLSLARLDGLMDGLKARQAKEIENLRTSGRQPIEIDDAMWPFYPVTYMSIYELNSNTELGEIVGSLAKDGESVNTGRHTGGDEPSAELADLRLKPHEMAEETKCSSLVKLLNIENPEEADIIVSHNTWTSYSEMLRIYKTLNFDHVAHPSFVSRRFNMASYPGYLSSTDDWLTMRDTGILVTETTNECISNKRLRKYVVPNSVTTVIRSVIASVMASSGSQWFETFSRENSGTYNNQWIVVDYARFREWKRSPLAEATDILWIGEQAPGLLISKDMTAHLWETSYWASYNRPYFSEIADVSGYSVASKLKGEWYHHQKCPRARMFTALHSAVTDIDSMKAIMTLNRWDVMNATYLHTHTCPKNQIAGRYDIDAHLDVNSDDFKKCGPVMAYGALDCKITNSDLMNQDSVLFVSAPLWNNSVPAFDWSTYPVSEADAHWGHPEVWNFDFVKWTGSEMMFEPQGSFDPTRIVLPEFVIGVDPPKHKKVKLPQTEIDYIL